MAAIYPLYTSSMPPLCPLYVDLKRPYRGHGSATGQPWMGCECPESNPANDFLSSSTGALGQTADSGDDVALHLRGPGGVMAKIDHGIAAFVSAFAQDAERGDVSHEIVGVADHPGIA